MKTKLIVLGFFCFSFVNAQTANTPAPADSAEVFQFVEEMPEFPGGQEEMYKFIVKNINYPAKEKEAGLQGTVYISFIVSEVGKVTNVKVLRGVTGAVGLDNEAVRVVKLFPNFKPGKQNGKPVNVKYTLPIKFKLQETNKK